MRKAGVCWRLMYFNKKSTSQALAQIRHTKTCASGTGFGSSIGENNSAVDAEFSSMPFLQSKAEDYFSTKWFVKRYQELSGEEIMNVKDLSERINHSAIAKKVFREFSSNLATFLKGEIYSINPDIIIIGGNVVNAKAYFLEELREELLARRITIGIKISKLGEDAALIGAASWWNEKNADLEAV